MFRVRDLVNTTTTTKGSGIGDVGWSSLEQPRLWVGGLWLGRTLGVPSCPELQGAPGGVAEEAELRHR